MKEFIIKDAESLRAVMVGVWNCVCEAIKGGAVSVTVARPSKTREQEKRYHAMIGDISAQVSVYGKKYPPEIWKALLVDHFEQEMAAVGTPIAHPGRTIPSLDGTRAVTVRPSTTQFRKAEGADFIEFLYSQGAEMGVGWSEPAMAAYEEHILMMRSRDGTKV